MMTSADDTVLTSASQRATSPEIQTLAQFGHQQLLLRPVQARDKSLFQIGFDNLSGSSRRSRYGFAKKDLSADELRLATEVDGVDHVAWVAILLNGHGGECCGIGEARFLRLRRDPALAEVALTVIDSWQQRGIAQRLLDVLERDAQANGIERFLFDFDNDNLAVRALLQRRYPHAEFSARGALLSAVCSLPWVHNT